MVKKLLFIYILFVPLFTVLAQTKERAYQSKYFVILIIDGPRYSETYGDTSCSYIPFICDSLRPEGTFFSNFKNLGPTYTIPGHTAIMTGNYQRISNLGTELPKKPSLFQYYIKSKGVLNTDAQIIGSKGKLDVLANTKDKKWKDQYKPYSYCGTNGSGIGYAGDDKTMEKVSSVLHSENPPHLMLINLLGVDVEGHANNWKKYLQNIQKTDQYALRIWDSIQSNPLLRNQTTLFITNDHGRHLDGVKTGFANHGDGCEGCRHISLLVLGPEIPKNKTIETEAEMIDISKTISIMMGVQMPTGKGRFLEEIFIEK